jgi:hypothetical protein
MPDHILCKSSRDLLWQHKQLWLFHPTCSNRLYWISPKGLLFDSRFFDAFDHRFIFAIFDILPACLIFVYIWLLWKLIEKPVANKISSMDGNLFIFRLVCYFCPGSQKINILTAQYKRISNKQRIPYFDAFSHRFIFAKVSS